MTPDGRFALSDAARVRSLRPAADVLFASVAPICTTRVIAVVLTGWDSDGSNGIQIIKHWGGTVIAQDEASSEVFQMPRSAWVDPWRNEEELSVAVSTSAGNSKP